MPVERKMKYSVICSARVLSLLLQALRLIFIVGCQFHERFPYENVEALARQSLAFVRLSMKLFGSRSARFHRVSLPACSVVPMFSSDQGAVRSCADRPWQQDATVWPANTRLNDNGPAGFDFQHELHGRRGLALTVGSNRDPPRPCGLRL